MIPDGGIGRFRVYGTIPPPPLGLGLGEIGSGTSVEEMKLNVLDLAHVINGGRVVYTSDQHFGVGSNLLLPGRGKDMGDGWETKRSRGQGHKDFVVIQLGEAGLLNYAEIDTAHFLGNFPESVELHGAWYPSSTWPVLPGEGEEGEKKNGIEWTQIAVRTKMGPGKQHFLPLTNVEAKPFSHVKVTMHPVSQRSRGNRGVHRLTMPLSIFRTAESSACASSDDVQLLCKAGQSRCRQCRFLARKTRRCRKSRARPFRWVADRPLRSRRHSR